MRKVRLGKSQLMVSPLCFGTEPFTIKKGPVGRKTQGDRSPMEGGKILREALRMGVNFWDTSDDYFSHPHVAEGLKLVDREKVIVTDKSYALTLEEGRKAVEKSLRELGTDYIDIMMLHYIPFKSHWVKQKIKGKTVEYESGNLQKRMGALKAFCEAKESGVIKAVGLSTHSTQVLKQALEVPEIDVVLTVLNKKGSWIEDGSLEVHLDALENIHKTGKGVYVCKVVDAGKLRDEGDSAIRFVLQYHSFIDAFNIGMYDKEEIVNNIRIFDEVLGK